MILDVSVGMLMDVKWGLNNLGAHESLEEESEFTHVRCMENAGYTVSA